MILAFSLPMARFTFKILFVFLYCHAFSQEVFIANKNGNFIEDLKFNRVRVSIVEPEKALSTGRRVLVSNGTDTLRTKIYLFFDKKLIVKYCGMALFEQGICKWKKGAIDCISNEFDYAITGGIVYFIPIFSHDYQTFLYEDENGPMFVDRSAIIEIDLDTGKKTSIIKKAKNPVYDPGYHYILAQDKKRTDRYFIYDRTKKKIIRKYKNVQKIYWVE
jgi:hypothetical protein